VANEDVLRALAEAVRLDGTNLPAFAELLCEVYEQRENNDLAEFTGRLTESGGRYGFSPSDFEDLHRVVENAGGFEMVLDDLCRYGRDNVLAAFAAALAEDEPELAEVAEEAAAEDGFDETALFPWLAEQVEWDGAEGTWPAARTALLATASGTGRPDIAAAADAFLARLDSGDKLTLLASHGVVITPPVEFDEGTVFPWLAGQLSDWDGTDASWPKARAEAETAAASRPDLAAGATVFLAQLDAGDKVALLARHGVVITPPVEFDEDTVFPWLAGQLSDWDGTDAGWPKAWAEAEAAAADRPDLAAGAQVFLAQLESGDKIALLARHGVVISPAAELSDVELTPEQIEAAVPELQQQLDAAAAAVDVPPDVVELVNDDTVLREVLAEVPGAAELDAAGLAEVMQQVAAGLAA
jgi:hypothetical protein